MYFHLVRSQPHLQHHTWVTGLISQICNGGKGSWEEQSKFGITGLALQPSSLSIQATNEGNASILFSIAVSSSQFSVNGGDAELISVSQMFVVEPNATIVAVNGGSTSSAIVKLDTWWRISARTWEERYIHLYGSHPDRRTELAFSAQSDCCRTNVLSFP